MVYVVRSCSGAGGRRADHSEQEEAECVSMTLDKHLFVIQKSRGCNYEEDSATVLMADQGLVLRMCACSASGIAAGTAGAWRAAPSLCSEQAC